MKATFNFDTYIGGSRFRCRKPADEAGAFLQNSVLNVGYDATVDSGGGTATVTFTCTDDEEFATGDHVTFYSSSGSVATRGGIVQAGSAGNEVDVASFETSAPANTTAGKLVKETVFDAVFVGANVAAIAAYCDAAAFMLMYNDSDGTELTYQLTAGESWWWIEDMDLSVTNAISGITVETVSFSMYGAAGTEVVKFGVIHDNLE
jgi:hypothetical protein